MNTADNAGGAVAADERGVDAGGVVAVDVPCRSCRYNLRGLRVDGYCPECGGSVRASLGSGLLRYADPQWVDRLARGSRAVVRAVATLCVLILIAMLKDLLFDASGSGGTAMPPTLETVFHTVMTAVMVSALVVMGAGVWLITTPDPTGLGEKNYSFPRRTTRVALAALAAVPVLMALAARLAAAYPIAGVVLAALDWGRSLLMIVGPFAYVSYLSKLMLRVPNAALAGFGDKLKRWMAAGLLLIFLIPVVALRIPGVYATVVVALLMLGLWLALLLAWIHYQVRIGRALAEQADLARETWGLNPDALRGAATGTDGSRTG